MLGGSVWIAFIRFALGLGGCILLFSLLCESRFDRKKTVVSYSVFSLLLILAACVWYVIDWESCVRIVAFAMYVCFAAFAVFMSKDSIYLTIYKLALVFYLLAVFLVGGLEVSILFFERNVWADIITRILLIILIAFLLHKYVRKHMRDFGSYVEKELDQFSVVGMIVCLLFGIGYILNPALNREMTPHRIYLILINFVLVGALQLIVMRLYLHVGREKEYARENQLMQLNNRLLERQMELQEKSAESGRRIRHDVRHHNAVIAEYARRGQTEELLRYLQEYDREIDRDTPEAICANTAVNNILSAYTQKARQEEIRVTLDVELSKSQGIADIDLVAILANAYENAIYACMEVRKQEERECFIHLMLKKKKNKLTISCSNTCLSEARLKDGQPGAEFTGGIGVSSIIRTAEKYDGEYDFKNDNGVFVFRLILNMEPENAEGK
ncbi:MAG: ATP-binding protein [Bacteroidales bacterium]|nr:ATP-binding protein [Bacteroidales bacterium]MCM1415089.1 ATP-binding protein [bacterium]MCM1424396.1 ATP-binding protein [bacterium]